MEELRECLCGNEAHLIFEEGTKVADPWSVACKNFDCPWIFQTFPIKEEAVKHWNTRATDPLLNEMAEALLIAKNIINRYANNNKRIAGYSNIENVLQKYHEQEDINNE